MQLNYKICYSSLSNILLLIETEYPQYNISYRLFIDQLTTINYYQS